MGKPVLLWEPCYSLGNKTIVWVVWKVRTNILLANLVCFDVQYFPWSAHLKILLIFVILMMFRSICIHSFFFKLILFIFFIFFYISFFLCVFFFASFFSYYYLSIFMHLMRQFSVKNACVSLFPCVSLYRWIQFPRSVLSVLSALPVVVHSFLRKRMFSFIFMKSHRFYIVCDWLKVSTNHNKLVLVVPVWQNHVSKCACESDLPVWMNFHQATLKCSKEC